MKAEERNLQSQDFESDRLRAVQKIVQIDSWRNSPISVIEPRKGEGKAHICDNAWLDQWELCGEAISLKTPNAVSWRDQR